MPIADIYQPYEKTFQETVRLGPFDLTNENAQARIRGNILMAWSNRTGAMVLSTGNKSEMAVGYCTLYGDMAGGLALLGDVYKTMVYRVAAWLNREAVIIPRASIESRRQPELRPEQTDQDSLPPYDVLDAILKLYIEEWKEVDAIVADGFRSRARGAGPEDGRRKRIQAPPGRADHSRVEQSIRQRTSDADRAAVAAGRAGAESNACCKAGVMQSRNR